MKSMVQAFQYGAFSMLAPSCFITSYNAMRRIINDDQMLSLEAGKDRDLCEAHNHIDSG